MNNDSPSAVEQLVRLIEVQLDWGERALWSNKDFQKLSDEVFAKTKKQISVTTLKRICGRAKLVANPSITTLDILSEFAGYDDWRDFKRAYPSLARKRVKAGYYQNKLVWLVGGSVFVLAGLLGVFAQRQNKSLKSTTGPLTLSSIEKIQFDFKKVTTGYPNTVIFSYDIGDIPYDTLQIQQSWDKSRRIILDKPKGVTTTTYYTAGYYSTKLVLNKQIVKEKDLYIPTNGWQAYIGGNVPRIIYLKENQLVRDSIISLSKEVLDEMNRYNPSSLCLSRLQANPHIDSKDFELETEFRLASPTDKTICQHIWLTIMGTKDVFRFQFSIPGCVGDLMFFLNTEMISGRNEDLSKFGLDLSQWTQFKVTSKENRLKVFINGDEVFGHTLSGDIGMIGGVQYVFEGIPEVRSLRMTDKEKVEDLMYQAF